jgi:sporulation-control protein spo0M
VEKACIQKGDIGVIEVLATNDPIRLNFAETVLRDAGLHVVTLDAETAAAFGGALPWVKRRILVPDDEAEQALRLLKEFLPQDDEA